MMTVSNLIAVASIRINHNRKECLYEFILCNPSCLSYVCSFPHNINYMDIHLLIYVIRSGEC